MWPLAASLIPVLLTLLLIIEESEWNSRLQAVVVWLAGLGLFTLATVLVRQSMREHGAGYRLLAVVVTWLTFGLPAALTVLVCGTLIVAALRYTERVPARRVVEQVWLPGLVCTTSLLAAGLVYSLLGGVTPLRSLDGQTIVPLLLALASGFAIRYVLYIPLGIIAPPNRLMGHPEQVKTLVNEFLLLPALLILPLILYQVGVAAFVVMMFVLATHVVRYHRLNQHASESSDLARNLSLISDTASSVAPGSSQQNALRSVCQTALTVTHANKASVLLFDHDRENLNLAESIGLTSEHLSLISVIPYQNHVFSTSPRIVADATLGDSDPMTIRLARAGQFRAFAQMPLSMNDLVRGYLTVYHDAPHVYTEMELYLLRILCSHLSAALENAQLLRDLEVYAFKTTYLMQLSGNPASNMQLDEVAADVSAVLRMMMSVDWVLILLLDQEKDQAQVLGAAHDPTRESDAFNLALSGGQLKEMFQLQPPDCGAVRIFQRDDIQLPKPLSAFMQQRETATLVVAPMLVHDALFGVILLGSATAHIPGKNNRQLLEAAANQITTRLYNAHLYTTTQSVLNRRLQQLALMESIVQQISSSRNFNQIINDVLEAAVTTTHANMVALALLTEVDDLWVIVQKYNGEPRKFFLSMRKDEGVIGRVVQTGEIERVADNQAVDYYVPTPPDVYRSSLAVPLIRDQSVIGALNVESTQTNFFTHEQALFLKNLGAHAIISIENARLLEELQYQIETLTSLRELSLDLSPAVETRPVAQAVLERALKIVHAQYALLFRYERSGDRLALVASVESDAMFATETEVDRVRHLARQAAATGEIQKIEPLVAFAYDGSSDETTQHPSIVAIPIKRGDEVREILCVGFADQQILQSRELNSLSLLAIQAAGHLENAMLHEKIRDNNDRMRAILDSTRDGVILLDDEGHVEEVNPWAEKLLGINLSEHIGEYFVGLLLRYSDPNEEGYAGYSREELKNLARLQRLESESITRRQFERRLSQNQSIYIEEIGSPVIDEDNRVTGRLLVLRDITEEKQLEIFRDEISSMVVHDLRGPLGSVINSVGIVRENIPDLSRYSEADQALRVTLNSANRLMNMVNSLIDIARLESRQMKLEPAPWAIESLIESAHQSLMSSIQQAGQTLEIRLAPQLPLVHVDGDKIRRVLVNLLDNASRFTLNGGKILIVVTPEMDRERLLVQVADNGPGIPAAEREHIFEKYRQVKGNLPLRGSKGTGLGLTFCKLVLEAHGQRIWVEPDGPLSGACFAFTLPIAE